MAIKDKLLWGGVALLAVVALAKPIGGLFGQVGTTIGSSFQMGLQNFVSALSGGIIPNSSVMMGSNQSMTSEQMMMNSQMMMKPVLVGNVDTTGNTGGLIPGKDSFGEPIGTRYTIDSMGNTIDPTGRIVMRGIIDSGMGSKVVQVDTSGNIISPKTGAVDITTENVNSLIDMLTGTIRSSSADVTLTSSSINDIFKQATDFFLKGGQDVSSFLKTYRFPSGETLQDVLGGVGKGSLTPEAFGMLQTIAQSMGMPSDGLVHINTSLPKMLQMMNLNIDNKIDTPYGVISYGSTPGGIGTGKGTILPPQNLTQVLQQHPELTASQAADLLYRMMNPQGEPTLKDSNTGSGLISTFSTPTKDMPIPMVLNTMINPVLLAYQNYKAMYGIS